jgi:hypothetical protein
MSIEVDILPIAEGNEETARLADLIEGAAGEFSPFEELHGFSIDGVDLHTSVLPQGWRDRLVKVQNANTSAASGEPQFTGWWLDKEDLCATSGSASRSTGRVGRILSVWVRPWARPDPWRSRPEVRWLVGPLAPQER